MEAESRYNPVTDAPNDESSALSSEAPAPARRPAPTPPVPSPAPKSRAKFVVVIVLVVLIAATTGLWLHFRQFESTDDAQIDGHVHAISPRVAGYVTKVNVDDNQFVHAGDVMVEIDPTDYKVAVAKAQAELVDAEATAQGQAINVPVTFVNTSSQIRFSSMSITSRRLCEVAVART